MTLTETRERDPDLILSKIGLSRAQTDYVRNAPGENAAIKLYRRGYVAWAALLVVLLIGGYKFSQTVFLDNLIEARTQGAGYLYYDSVWWSHLVPLSVAVVLLPGWVLYKFLGYFPQASALIALKSLNDIANRKEHYRNLMHTLKLDVWYARKLLDGKFHALPIEQGLVYFNRKKSRWIGLCIGLLILWSLPLMVLDSQNYQLITNEGVIERRYAGSETVKRSWSDVSVVKTGCFFFTGKDGGISLRYTIMFGDGWRTDLFDATPGGYAFDNIGIVDQRLRQLGKPFAILAFLPSGEMWVNDMCFIELRKLYGDYSTRVIELLHLKNYPAAQPQ